MDISIIIPCYNSGAYLQDAIDSVERSQDADQYELETVIVDDGSTDPGTISLLDDLSKRGFNVIYRNNGGPAAARNTGVRASKGRYLLFLDSDNRLKPSFIQRGIKLFRTANADIIYGKPEFFGESTTPRFVTGAFATHKMLVENYIDACCMVRREVFEQTGGFDEELMIIGFEDWDFFLHAYSKGFVFHFVDEPLFEYRILSGSLSQAHTPEKIQKVKEYIYRKNIGLLVESLAFYRGQYAMYNKDKSRPIRSFIKYLYHKVKGGQ